MDKFIKFFKRTKIMFKSLATIMLIIALLFSSPARALLFKPVVGENTTTSSFSNFSIAKKLLIGTGGAILAGGIIALLMSSSGSSASVSSAKDIVDYSINGEDGLIDATYKTITVTLPYGTNLDNLVAKFITTGASVKVGAINQVSGITANNFANPIIYTVTAADGTVTNYTVIVSISKPSDKKMLWYSIKSRRGDIEGVIDEAAKTISVVVPYKTSRKDLVAEFDIAGSNITANGVNQISGQTHNDFTDPIVYTVIAEDNTTVSYTVIVTNASSSAKSILLYSIGKSIVRPVDQNITVTVPIGTDVTKLVAKFITSGEIVKVGNEEQIYGVTSNNFTKPVTYTVIAADGSTNTYVVTIVFVCTVTYDGNGNTSGTIPTDNTAYGYGSSVAVMSDGGLTGPIGSNETAGIPFMGWNTKSDGTGILYYPGDAFSITQNTTLYATWIGASYGGGTVVYIGTASLEPKRILIMANEDCTKYDTFEWAINTKVVNAIYGYYNRNNSSCVSGYTCDTINSGSVNVKNIRTNMGTIDWVPAAKAAQNYNGGGYTDWYLPSMWELNIMYNYATNGLSNGGCGSDSRGNFRCQYYWSSTEDVSGETFRAWSQYFITGTQDSISKINKFYVRAVRSIGY